MRRLGFFLLLLLLFSGLVESQQSQPSPAPSAQAPASSPDHPEQASSSPSIIEPKPESQSPKPDLTPDANGALSQEQMQQLFRVVADKDIENDKRQRDYTYTEQEVQHNLDGKGKVKSTETKTYEIMEVYGEQIQRLIEKDGKSLSEKDAAKEEAKIQKAIDKRKNESEGDSRNKRKIEKRGGSSCVRLPRPTTSSWWARNPSADARCGLLMASRVQASCRT